LGKTGTNTEGGAALKIYKPSMEAYKRLVREGLRKSRTATRWALESGKCKNDILHLEKAASKKKYRGKKA